mmetsp:Transcript_82862/g.238090  ORF Transcript_82862/g.238090 Transcript_82862/m.238090 type:complete len:300 (-) Transcript_82862:236-1135(-)
MAKKDKKEQKAIAEDVPADAATPAKKLKDKKKAAKQTAAAAGEAKAPEAAVGDKQKKAKEATVSAGSPKVAPKAAPKAPPKPEATAAPKAAPKPEVSAEKRKAIEEKAINVIKEGIEKDKLQKEQGLPFMPQEWPTEFKPILGAYRKFVESCGHFDVVQGEHSAKYTIQVRDAAAIGKPQVRFEMDLRKAWEEYCKESPKADNSEFIRLSWAVTKPDPNSKVAKLAAKVKDAKANDKAGGRRLKKKAEQQKKKVEGGGEPKRADAGAGKKRKHKAEGGKGGGGGKAAAEEPQKKKKKTA